MNETVTRRNVGDVSVLTRYLRDGKLYLNLTGYAVTIRITRKGVTKVNRAIVAHPDQATYKGRIDYTPQASDVDTKGIYRVEIIADNGTNTISFPRGDKQRFYLWIG